MVSELESEVATLLGKPAAAFLPSGTMAQQITLRVHADRRRSCVVVFHPTCHVDVDEGRGYERLHGLIGRPAGNPSPVSATSSVTGTTACGPYRSMNRPW